MRVIDITLPHSDASTPWTGDTLIHPRLPVPIRPVAPSHSGGITTRIHNGTQLDAPDHFDDGGQGSDGIPTDRFVGPARVFAAHGYNSIPREVFAGLDGHATPRVLVATRSGDDRSVFLSCIPTLAAGVPAWLGTQGVTLIGLDLPSVDPLDSDTRSNHHALHDAGILILENLDLRDVAPGEYELIALPLRSSGADGSPVRAILVEH